MKSDVTDGTGIQQKEVRKSESSARAMAVRQE